ncbi:hypothetical protein LWI28_020346 [Acer negundo]|uniref:Remorin C-terminal domain-containing protein n=1 Tax=Acer negundo TaxID=4023 RepID=A0AAD5IGA3_ACENE|nr:hypothetical protein LWI28_020346 [Acer negundo]KAK4837577.1 hypothetical protein QYF36_006637 [Acer negundo]
MLNPQRLITNGENNDHDHQDQERDDEPIVRDIHALTPPPALPINGSGGPRREASWETSSAIETGTESDHHVNMNNNNNNNHSLLARIREDDIPEETNPLAIVPDLGAPFDHSDHHVGSSSEISMSVQRVKKEEVESKISAWQNAKVAKINNRFKREEAVINGWESEQVQKATSWMKKVERKLEEKRAKALEKMQNDVAKAHRKAEERRASSEGKRGTKVARVLEVANLMRAVGRPPLKRSFF